MTTRSKDRFQGWPVGEGPYDETPGNFFRGILWAVVLVILLAAIFFSGVLVGRAWGDEPKTWNIKLAWDPNTEPDLREYRLYENGAQVEVIPAGQEEVARTLPAGTYTWYLTAVDQALNESGPSNEVGLTLDEVPPAAPTFHVTVEVSVQAR